MIEVRPRGLVAGRRQWRGMRLSALALLCSVGALAGCDTVARLAFLDNEFNEVQTLGLTPPVGACGGTTDGNATLRFVMLDSQRNTIGAGDSLGSQAVQFGRNDLALSNAALFDLPDEACDGTCDQMRLSCQVSDATFDSSLARCNRQSAVSSQDPVFVGSRDKRLVFTLLMENTTSLTGRLPSEMSNLFPDSDGDGMTNAQWSTQALQEPERATDPGNARTSMASQILTSWKAMATRAVSARNSEAFFGMWTFGGGTAGLKSMLPGEAELVRAGSGAASGGGAVDTALASYASLPLRTEIASVYESMSAVLTNTEGMARADVNGADKLLVVFVDGPDELRNPLFSADKVITDAKAVGARVIIVHLDSSVTLRSPMAMEPYFIDTPSYIERQTACASDASCHNFEECRKTTGYATAQGQTPTLPAGVDLSATFCHVKRDENGRVGPIDDYARIACETGGGYVYVPEPGQTGELGARAGWLPYVQDGLWEVPVTFDALARGDVEGGQGYKVQLEVSATVLDVQKPQSMSQLGLPLGNERDSRLVLFSGGQ
jgi:hypothetical protein